MPHAIEAKRYGLKKEAVRLTGEAAPDTWVAVEADSELDYVHAPVPDTGIRGIKAPFPSFPGPKTLTGLMKLPARARNIGEFLQMALGNPTSVQQGVTNAYKHTFTVPAATTQLPTYTFFIDRSLSIKKYNGCGVKKITFNSPVDNAIMMENEMLGISEAAGAIGVPVYTESEELEFFQTTFKIDGAQDLNVKDWQVSIDNGMFAQRTQNLSQDAKDLIAAAKLSVSGEFTIYFEASTQRDKFLANTAASIEMLIEGNTADAPHKNTLDILIPSAKYKAFPFGEADGLLAARVQFDAEYDTGSSKLAELYLINLKAAY